MANNDPVFIDINTPKSIKIPKDIKLKENIDSKEGIELDVNNDSSGLIKKGFKVDPKETQNPKTV